MTLPVLLYHGVGESADPRFARWVVSPRRFAEQMDLLAAEGYRTLTASEAAEYLRRDRGTAQERAVAITFDDGFAEVHGAAWPQLRRRELSATVFIATGYVGATSRWLDPVGEAARPMLTWDQIVELSEGGIEIGAHSDTHPQLDIVGRAQAAREIERSRDSLTAVLGPVRSFAYPHGYHTAAIRRLVRAAGFESAFAVGDGVATAADDRYAITRAIVGRETTIDGFERILASQIDTGRRPLRRAAWRTVRRAGAESWAGRQRDRLAGTRRG